MARRCALCDKGPVAGRTYARSGKAKKEGGVGKRILGKTNRRFMPNLQRVRSLFEGKIQFILACTKCIKKGRLVRPPLAEDSVSKPAAA
jgi:large subunit ribosomal protein L28